MLLQLCSAAALIATASITAYYGAWLAHSREATPSTSILDSLESHTISWQHACMLPLFASLVLVLLYFAFAWLDWFLVLYLLGVACVSVAYSVFAIQKSTCGLRGWSTAASIALGVITTAIWAATGSPLAIDVVGVSICITSIQVIRLPSAKVGAIALAGLLIYDVYWVFVSAMHFKSNVMVAVASQRASNPLHTAAAVIPGMQSYLPPPKLDMPNKLLMPALAMDEDGGVHVQRYMMLGLGDIVVPALVLALARRMDCNLMDAAAAPTAAATEEHEALLELESGDGQGGPVLRVPATPAAARVPAAFDANMIQRARPRFLLMGIVGYVAGLLLALTMSTLFEAAQPALLYLVPCVFASTQGWPAVQTLWNGTSIDKGSD